MLPPDALKYIAQSWAKQNTVKARYKKLKRLDTVCRLFFKLYYRN
jgi:hypothetical protein